MAEKDLFNGITKDHVLEAIQRVDEEGYPPPRRSTTYDLVYKGRAYPPKYVISLAGFFRNGKFIHESLFSGGETSASFPYLRDLGFDIVTKEEALKFVQSRQNASIQNKYLETDHNMEAPNFFTQTDFDQLKKFVGQEYDKDVPGMEETYQHLKLTYAKVEYWAERVVKEAFPNGRMNIRKRPTNQANKFEAYHWAKLYPNEDLLSWKHLAYTLTFSNREDLCVKIDNVGLGDNDPIRKKYLDYRGEFFSSPIVKIFKREEVDGMNWDGLISRSVQSIKALEPDYEKLLQLLGYYGSQLNDTLKSYSISVHSLNVILYGPPGTGKTYNSIDMAVQIAVPEKYSGQHKANKQQFDILRKAGQIEFITFHQNYTYEDFMVGIKPDIDNSKLRFVPYKGIFYQLCKRARDNYEASHSTSKLQSFDDLVEEMLAKISDDQPLELKTLRGKPFWLTDFSDKTIYLRKSTGSEIHTLSISTLIEVAEGRREMVSGLGAYYYPIIEYLKKNRKTAGTSEPLKNYVLVIDEINRANISKVFGELITLLEDDKRLGQDNEIRISLPNGEKDFGIPPNLYVIGTMNTADKSIALLDIALRRRFEFKGYYPIYEGYDSDAARLLEKINEKIYSLKNSSDYLIGHAYFMNGDSIEPTLRNKVIPLLMEYFSGKINLVSDIFKDTDWSVSYNTKTYSWDIHPKE